MWMIFCASASGSAVGAEAAASTAGAAAATTGGGGGAAGAAGSRSREIGGRTAARLIAPSPSGRFGFGFFSSIKETDSTGRGGAAGGAGFGSATGFGDASTRGLVVIGICARTGGAGAGAGFAFTTACSVGLAAFAGAGAFALLVSFFGSACAAVRDDAALFAAGFRAAALGAAFFVVVFVAIVKFWKVVHRRFTNQPALLCRRGLLMNRVVDFLRLRFVHRKNFHQIFHRRVA